MGSKNILIFQFNVGPWSLQFGRNFTLLVKLAMKGYLVLSLWRALSPNFFVLLSTSLSISITAGQDSSCLIQCNGISFIPSTFQHFWSQIKSWEYQLNNQSFEVEKLFINYDFEKKNNPEPHFHILVFVVNDRGKILSIW